MFYGKDNNPFINEATSVRIKLMSEHEPKPDVKIILGNPANRPIKKGQVWRHKEGPTYRVDKIAKEALDATFYESDGVLARLVTYTQLEDGEKYPAGTEWTRPDVIFVGGTEVNGQPILNFNLEQDVDDSAGN